ncbi:hypothetical protein AB0L49_37005 [Streptomyces antimycoticus]|uniref:hypothetical protein n=1 Tax=Streptomyces TaxID=1883 RepID=UPI00342EE627
MVAELGDDYPNETAALQAVAEEFDIGSGKKLRNWVKPQEIDMGQRSEPTTERVAQLRALKKEKAELKRVPTRPKGHPCDVHHIVAWATCLPFPASYSSQGNQGRGGFLSGPVEV